MEGSITGGGPIEVAELRGDILGGSAVHVECMKGNAYSPDARIEVLHGCNPGNASVGVLFDECATWPSPILEDTADCAYIETLGGMMLCELFHPLRLDEDVAIDYSVAEAVLQPGQSMAPHSMKNAEIQYYTKGSGALLVGGQALGVREGMLAYIPPGAVQSLLNNGTGELRFVSINDPAWRPENERSPQ
jgi:mannose-6-phosphate isomerase-like protein (cupin superfamily)